MTPDGSQPARRRMLRWLLAGAALAALVGVAVVWVVGWGGRRTLAPPAPADPRLTYTGPYLNVRPEVQYVGDDRCAACHPDVAALYRKHPMARSLTPIARLAPLQSYDATLHNPFEAFGSLLQVERQGDAVRHSRTRLDADGQPLFKDVFNVDHVIGSGVHGFSYLTSRDGFVFQTPISWFQQKHVWGLSPQFSPDYLSGRPVTAGCLFCHANRARPIEGTVNRYEEPVFEGEGVGCERCHGPGARHVQNPSLDPTDHFDHTIINPARLEPSLREAVCEQCHLEGAVRVLRRSRGVHDFRPGLPLEAFLSVFVKTPGGADRKAVNHVEQMYQSGCFRRGASSPLSPDARARGKPEDRIGCISCHDPHDYIGPDRRVAWYRQACLNCHERKQPGCSVSLAERRRTSPDDSCIHCHMPPYGASDIVHNASTDHRIPRRPDHPDGPDDSGGTASVQTPLATLFHHDELDARDPEYRRDLGLALASLCEREDAPEAAPREADALLDEAVKNFPGDVRAWEAKGRRALLEGRAGDALAAYEACLAGARDREAALDGAAEAARQLGKTDAAIDYGRRSVAIDPWSPAARQRLAELLASRENWDEARVQCREWLRQLPETIDARKLLIRCLLKGGDRAGAEAELKTLKALRPGSDADLNFWFSRQLR